LISWMLDSSRSLISLIIDSQSSARIVSRRYCVSGARSNRRTSCICNFMIFEYRSIRYFRSCSRSLVISAPERALFLDPWNTSFSITVYRQRMREVSVKPTNAVSRIKVGFKSNLSSQSVTRSQKRFQTHRKYNAEASPS
jgi:hypothetical protein